MLLNAAKDMAKDQMNMKLVELHDVPLFNEDVLNEGVPESVQAIAEQILQSDGIIISSPEYNYSISGVLKNTIDWLSKVPSGPLNKKPLGIMGTTPGNFGTVRGQMALRHVCVFTNMIPMNRPEMLLARAHEKFAPSGQLLDESSQKVLKTFLDAFYQWVQDHR